MRVIASYNEYLNMKKEHDYDFKYGTIIKMNLKDSSGEDVQLETELTEIGCSVDRRNIYHKFKILKTNSEKYPLGSEMYFPIEFNKKEFSFLINTYYTYSSGGYGYAEKHYRAYVELG